MATLPILYHKDKLGRLRLWRVWCEGNTVLNEYGLVDGEKVISSRISTPKNVGRSNERNAEEQAEFDAKSAWQFKVDRKYSETPEKAEEPLLLPMLINKENKKFSFECAYIQRKYDGVRCLAMLGEDGNVHLTSRAGKPYNVEHIATALKKILIPGLIFDGELYHHGTSLQTIISWVKKHKPESLNLEYHIYDLPIVDNRDDLPFTERSLNLIKMGPAVSPPLFVVPTYRVYSAEEAKTREQEFVADGFEGAIVRDGTKLYEFGHRSRTLYKIKSFDDAEFLVTGAKQGEGSFSDCAIFICETKEGFSFNVTPKGTIAQKKEYWTNQKNYIGKQLTVRYFGFTDGNLPFIPVGIGFRPPEDL